MTPVVPFRSARISSGLRRAAEYHEGRRLSDSEIVDVLMREVDAIILQWTRLGDWMTRLDNWYPKRLSGKTINNPSPELRARYASAMRASWARRRLVQMRKEA